MSQMPRLPPKRRQELIKTYIVDETEEKIAERCHCHRRTIIRDIKEMKRDGSWWEWIERALHRYSRSTEISDEVKFKEYAKLYSKQFITEKKDQTTTLTGPIVLRWDAGTHDQVHPPPGAGEVPSE